MPDKQMDTLTLNEFKIQLKALLKRAKDSGLNAEDFCPLIEDIVVYGWEE